MLLKDECLDVKLKCQEPFICSLMAFFVQCSYFVAIKNVIVTLTENNISQNNIFGIISMTSL